MEPMIKSLLDAKSATEIIPEAIREDEEETPEEAARPHLSLCKIRLLVNPIIQEDPDQIGQDLAEVGNVGNKGVGNSEEWLRPLQPQLRL